MDRILFILNPISGKGKKLRIEELIKNFMASKEIEYDLVYTEYAGHAYELTQENIGKYKTIVAVGGDGTINEVSKALVGKENLFGIIPLGSGNGLSRALGIPLNPQKALKRIVNGKSIKMDSGEINGHHFLNIAGIGFDADVAYDFDNSPTRGYGTYFRIVAGKFLRYNSTRYKLSFKNGESQTVDAFLLSIANSGQWGNDFYISPLSNVHDGKLDISILKKYPKIIAPILALRSKLKNIHKSRYMQTITLKEVIIESKEPIKGHIDGEPILFDTKLNINVLENSINIII